MKAIVSWFARDPVAANLLMIFVLIGGVLGSIGIGKEVIPSVPLDSIVIQMSYPGAGPTEVAEQIVVPIEEAVYNLDGVSSLRSNAWQGSGRVSVEVESGFDKNKLISEIQNNIDSIQTFPRDSERPRISEEINRTTVMRVSLSGDVEQVTLKRYAERIRDDLSRLPKVDFVSLQGTPRPEISIELEELAMQRFGISFDQVMSAVQRSSISAPAGSIRGENGTLQLQTRGQAFSTDEFNKIVIKSKPDGSRITVGDVATVLETTEDTYFLARLNAERVVFIDIATGENPDVVATTTAVKDYIENQTDFLPTNIKATAIHDFSVMFSDRLSLIGKNALGGLVLVFIILMLFLRPLVALWVSVGIGIAYAGALWLLPSVGLTLNMVSMFGFMLILGIIVDDAIIVGESIYRHQEEGYEALTASEQGAHTVLAPVLLAVATTIILFIPMLFLPGEFARMIWSIPVVALVALSFSLVECLLILPAHLAHMPPELPPTHKIGRGLTLIRARCAKFMATLSGEIYRPLLVRALAWRYLTIVCFLLALIFSLSLLSAGHVKRSFMPDVPWDFVGLEIRLPENYSREQMVAILERAERAAEVLESDEKLRQSGYEGEISAHTLSFLWGHTVLVWAELAPGVSKVIDPPMFGERWVHHTGEIPDAMSYQALAGFGSKENQGFSVLLKSDNARQLREASEYLETALREINGVTRTSDDSQGDRLELSIHLLPYANNIGVNLAEVATQVRQGFYGAEAQRVARGRDDLRVLVRYPETQRRQVDTFDEMRIRTPNGAEVPFYSVADVEYVPSYGRIKRSDRQRGVTIRAFSESDTVNADTLGELVHGDIRDEITARFPDVSVEKSGSGADEAEFFSAATSLVATALCIIYMLMVVSFKSYLKPLGVLTAVPFGVMGAIFGHALLGLEFSVMSWAGVFAAAGVVVNDNLVLMARINQLRQDGMDLDGALTKAGIDRFRPIILTSLTTFIGLMPILLETSLQAQFLIPMVVSLSFGVLFATLVTLVFVPALYLTAARWREYWRFADTAISNS
ncbi:MAG TPA: AcrB/AcrD/AcrF family protein [Porticoccaceae bacterium]|nr:AcrB/AcrD/AcrF family protein [Porticoccaceae bacterium]